MQMTMQMLQHQQQQNAAMMMLFTKFIESQQKTEQ